MMRSNFDRLLLDGARKVLQRREEGALNLDGGRDVHRRRERIVRRLRAVHMVVGVYGLLRAHCPAEHLDGAIRDDLIRVHVALRARPGLPDDQGELVIELAIDHLLRRCDDDVRERLIELAKGGIRLRRTLLDDAERMNERQRHSLAADLEVAEAPLCLSAPIVIGWHFDRAECVGLCARGLRRGGCGGSHGGSLLAGQCSFLPRKRAQAPSVELALEATV